MNFVVVASRSRGTFVSLREMLGQEFDLDFAESLPQVFDALAKRPTDLIFVDTQLADCEGKDAIREIAAASPETCLIYIAPAKDAMAAPVSEEEGVYASIPKPLNRDIVLFLAKKAVERRKLSRRIEYLTTLAETTSAEGSLRPPATGTRGTRVPGVEPFMGKMPMPLGRGIVRKLLRSISPVTDLNELLGRFGDSVRELFGSNNVAIFTWDPGKGRYIAGAWQGVDEGLAEVCSFSKKHGMVRWLIEHQQLITRDKLVNSFPHDIAVEVGTDMDALRADVIMPLMDKGNLIGFLSLGRKMTGKRYDEEDLELLAVIGDCASGAIGTSVVHRQLSAQKARAEAILNNISCGIVAVDTEGNLLSMNHFAESALEVNSEELIGRNIQKLGSVVADVVLRTIKEDRTYLNRPYRDGTTGRVFSVSTCKMCDERSNLTGAILFFTPLREAAAPPPPEGGEGQIPEDEVFAAFCGQVADRIKNPLASIKTFSQLLPEKYDDEEFREKFPEVVGRAVERINALADGLTSYAAAGPLDLSPTNVAAVVENALASLRNDLKSRDLRVIAPGSEKPAMVLADGKLVRSAFLNVLRNSIESTPSDGSITISIKEVSARQFRERKGGRLVCDFTGIDGKDGSVLDDEVFVETEFRDSGKGIAGAELGKVGQPFFTTKGEKVGLGLAIARKIVSRHRGRMEIESKEGEGTTVRIVLPREQNTQ